MYVDPEALKDDMTGDVTLARTRDAMDVDDSIFTV